MGMQLAKTHFQQQKPLALFGRNRQHALRAHFARHADLERGSFAR
jgi:hypothetical protein